MKYYYYYETEFHNLDATKNRLTSAFCSFGVVLGTDVFVSISIVFDASCALSSSMENL